jgi:hypothetical protein
MKTANELYESMTEKWFESERVINEKNSQVANNNKRIHAKPLAGLVDFDERERAIWEAINLLDQLYIESVKEKMLTLSCLVTLINTWHENYDQPSMVVASNTFFDQDFANVLKSSHAELAMMGVINDLRRLVILGVDNKRKNT